jgi:hypothetical protein
VEHANVQTKRPNGRGNFGWRIEVKTRERIESVVFKSPPELKMTH